MTDWKNKKSVLAAIHANADGGALKHADESLKKTNQLSLKQLNKMEQHFSMLTKVLKKINC